MDGSLGGGGVTFERRRAARAVLCDVSMKPSPQASKLGELEAHRPVLVGHCYRMLGSIADADDAVQETMVRAWKALERFDGRSSLRTWLYRIATNVCLDHLAHRTRRGRPVDEGPEGTIDDVLVERPRQHWLEPVPDELVIPPTVDPSEALVLRESIRLAFVAALQHLPPRQRAALLLTNVLGFSSAEVAELLGMSVASVNSALQRARAKLAEQGQSAPARNDSERLAAGDLSAAEEQLVQRYVDAFHRYDTEELAELLSEDAVLSMPPYTLWLRGRQAIEAWLSGRGIGCRGSRLIPARASGATAFGQYRPDAAGGHSPWSLVVLEVRDGFIRSMTHFLDTPTLFPRFGLPERL